MQIYCKNCKNTQTTRFQKKISPYFKNLNKKKSKCAICLTERTFIHEIEDKNNLGSKVKVYPKSFADRYKRRWRLIA